MISMFQRLPSRRATLRIAGLLWLVSNIVHATNLVENPGFDTTADWYTIVPDVIVFDSGDGQPPPSGSLTTYDAESISEAHSACIPIAASRADLSFDIKIRAGAGGLDVQEYSDGNCATYLDSTSNFDSNTGLPSWTTLSLFDFPLPVGTNSALIVLRVGPNPGDTVTPSSSFDNISFGPTDDIFRDGFE